METTDISPIIQQIIQKAKTTRFTKREIKAISKADDIRQSSPEYIDDYIFSMEHDYILDGIVDWKGCCIDDSWEDYKEKVGYYKRHPEREAESKAFTKNVMEWWAKQSEKIESLYRKR